MRLFIKIDIVPATPIKLNAANISTFYTQCLLCLAEPSLLFDYLV